MKAVIVILLSGFIFSLSPAIAQVQEKKNPGKPVAAEPGQDLKVRKAPPPEPSKQAVQKKSTGKRKPASKQLREHVPGADDQDPVVGKTSAGKPVYEGSRGGHYYVNKSGVREYVREFIGARIVGKTPQGDIIYEGPRGGRFYYDAGGEKRYIKSRKR